MVGRFSWRECEYEYEYEYEVSINIRIRRAAWPLWGRVQTHVREPWLSNYEIGSNFVLNIILNPRRYKITKTWS
jgi:hypothetical protein